MQPRLHANVHVRRTARARALARVRLHIGSKPCRMSRRVTLRRDMQRASPADATLAREIESAPRTKSNRNPSRGATGYERSWQRDATRRTRRLLIPREQQRRLHFSHISRRERDPIEAPATFSFFRDDPLNVSSVVLFSRTVSFRDDNVDLINN